ncbi:radical SAM protein [Actinoplanes regularis]|uniref:radical SAM protein n=1 Tax=Actinoplanes regularis TaxID=52697 RepID=UPI0024A047D0|nr:radical SAM protein [Actinoplanes regularis]GLW34945.1 hypothetical protein Areg01_78810 [Actinoplanes regularis]
MTGLRISDYAMFVPVRDHAIVLALNTCYGTVVELSEETYRRLGEPAGLPADVLSALADGWIVTALSPETERDAFARELHRRGRAALDAPPRVYLMPSYDCNLKCVYCFQHGIRRTTPSVTMSESVALAALDHAVAVLGDHPREVTLYGGEALSPDNRAVVEFLCRAARERGIRLMASTHAWNLDRYEDLLGPAGIEAIHVTVDGPAATHDRLRVGPRGARTYETIMRHIGLALGRGTRVRMRVNVNHRVLEELGTLRDELAAGGLLGNPLFSAYLAPMFDTKAHVDAGNTVLSRSLVGEAALAARLGGSTELATAFCGYPPTYDRVAAALAAMPPLPAVGNCCYGTPTVVLDPRGDVYPCVFLAGETRFAAGSYLGGGSAPERSSGWVGEGTGRCGETGCKFALYCGGGSPYDSFARQGSTQPRSCDCGDFKDTFAGYAAAAYRRRVAAD